MRRDVGIGLGWPAAESAVGGGRFCFEFRGFSTKFSRLFFCKFHVRKLILHANQMRPENQSSPLPVIWLGARVRNITNEGEMSAFGLPGVTGVLVLEVPAESPLAKAGLRKNDIILSVRGETTPDTAALLRHVAAISAVKPLKIGLSRDQKEIVMQVVQ